MSDTNELKSQLFAPNKTAVDEIYHLEMFANKHKLVVKQITEKNSTTRSVMIILSL